MRIGIDVDGVLYPWADAANEAVMARFGVPDPGPHRRWEWLKECITPEQWDWLWTVEGQDIVFGQLERVYPGAADAINIILRLGHKVHFVTHRDPRRTCGHTAAFLMLHVGRHPWAGLHVLQNGTPKHSLARWDMFVDDKPSTVLDMLLKTKAQVFCPARPWNESLEEESLPHAHRLIRYDDPAEMAEWVLAQ